MAKAKTKEELLAFGQAQFDKLLLLVNSIPEEDWGNTFPEGTLNRNLRDVLAHIHHWHVMLLKWYVIGKKGEKPVMPAEGYKWNELPALNLQIRDQYSAIDAKKAISLLKRSHKKVMSTIALHSQEELFTKKKYVWTGSTSMAAYFISGTSSHYDWGIKFLKKRMR